MRSLCTSRSYRYGIRQQLLLVGAGLLLVQPTLARNEVGGRSLQVCIGNQGYPPFTYEYAEGRLQYSVREAVNAQGWHVEFVAKPWRRCALDIQRGVVQAIAPVFPNAEHMQRMVFSQVDGVPNAQHSLGMASMVLLHTAGSQVGWKGQVFSGLKGPLLYQSGVSTLSLILSRMQVDADEAAPMAQTLARMLLKGRSNAAIISEYDALELFEQAEFKGQFEIKPFVSGTVYLAFSKQFYHQHRQAAEQIWERIGHHRGELRNQDVTPYPATWLKPIPSLIRGFELSRIEALKQQTHNNAEGLQTIHSCEYAASGGWARVTCTAQHYRRDRRSRLGHKPLARLEPL